MAADGKPFLSTVWLEVTSFCNQKCTFCPDPQRESKRHSIDVPSFKRLVDELVADFHVGHMELNAYGEALLHARLDEMLAYLRDKQVPWPTYFTTHGLTLLPAKIDMLDKLHPTGIAVSLHNDSQESYEATRSAKIGTYELLVERVTALLTRLVANRRACSVRLYLMVANGKQFYGVPEKIVGAFPSDWQRFAMTVRFWERVTHAMASGPDVEQQQNSDDEIRDRFQAADQGEGVPLDLVRWRDEAGNVQRIFISPRPTATYANLIPAMHPEWKVTPAQISEARCTFTSSPSLAISAGGTLGICCIDLEGTATFGRLEDFADLKAAVSSEPCLRFFAELANGVAHCKGCQTCLGRVQRRSP